jgi:hypothetical protein
MPSPSHANPRRTASSSGQPRYFGRPRSATSVLWPPPPHGTAHGHSHLGTGHNRCPASTRPEVAARNPSRRNPAHPVGGVYNNRRHVADERRSRFSPFPRGFINERDIMDLTDDAEAAAVVSLVAVGATRWRATGRDDADITARALRVYRRVDAHGDRRADATAKRGSKSRNVPRRTINQAGAEPTSSSTPTLRPSHVAPDSDPRGGGGQKT